MALGSSALSPMSDHGGATAAAMPYQAAEASAASRQPRHTHAAAARENGSSSSST